MRNRESFVLRALAKSGVAGSSLGCMGRPTNKGFGCVRYERCYIIPVCRRRSSSSLAPLGGKVLLADLQLLARQLSPNSESTLRGFYESC